MAARGGRPFQTKTRTKFKIADIYRRPPHLRSAVLLFQNERPPPLPPPPSLSAPFSMPRPTRVPPRKSDPVLTKCRRLWRRGLPTYHANDDRVLDRWKEQYNCGNSPQNTNISTNVVPSPLKSSSKSSSTAAKKRPSDQNVPESSNASSVEKRERHLIRIARRSCQARIS